MSANYLVKCSKCRCGHIHAESERFWVQDKGMPIDSKTSRCPKCDCDSVYYLKRGKREGMVPASAGERDQWLTATPGGPAMSEQIPLLEVPPNRTKLEIWKARYFVTAENKPDLAYDPDCKLDWIAFIRIGDSALGATEEDACFALAEKLKLPWLESVKLQAGGSVQAPQAPPANAIGPSAAFDGSEATLPTPSANLGDSEPRWVSGPPVEDGAYWLSFEGPHCGGVYRTYRVMVRKLGEYLMWDGRFVRMRQVRSWHYLYHAKLVEMPKPPSNGLEAYKKRSAEKMARFDAAIQASRERGQG